MRTMIIVACSVVVLLALAGIALASEPTTTLEADLSSSNSGISMLCTNTPSPSKTPVPPTDTPIPPTDTPIPPTETPVPPTDTPISTPEATITPEPRISETPTPDATATEKPRKSKRTEQATPMPTQPVLMLLPETGSGWRQIAAPVILIAGIVIVIGMALLLRTNKGR